MCKTLEPKTQESCQNRCYSDDHRKTLGKQCENSGLVYFFNWSKAALSVSHIRHSFRGCSERRKVIEKWRNSVSKGIVSFDAFGKLELWTVKLRKGSRSYRFLQISQESKKEVRSHVFSGLRIGTRQALLPFSSLYIETYPYVLLTAGPLL